MTSSLGLPNLSTSILNFLKSMENDQKNKLQLITETYSTRGLLLISNQPMQIRKPMKIARPYINEKRRLQSHELSLASAIPAVRLLIKFFMIKAMDIVIDIEETKTAFSDRPQLIRFLSIQLTKSPQAASPTAPKKTMQLVFFEIGKLSIHHLMKRSQRKTMKREYIIPILKMMVQGYCIADCMIVGLEMSVVSHWIEAEIRRWRGSR